MIKKFELGFKIHTTKESPYEITIARENPTKKQVIEIRDWIYESITDYLTELYKEENEN